MVSALLMLIASNPTMIVQVAPGGPIRSIDQALGVLRRQPSRGPAEIRVASGVYFLDHPIVLGEQDAQLTITGPTKGSARLVGGRIVDRWAPVTDPPILERLPRSVREMVRVADLRSSGVADLGEFRRRGFSLPQSPAGLEVFFQAEPMTPARYPNANGADRGWLRIANTRSETSFIAPDGRPGTWRSTDDVWVYGYWKYDWADSCERVVGFDPATRALSTQDKGGSYGFDKGRRFFYSHVLEELDEPGEWWLDRRSGKLYFLPPNLIRKGDVVVSVISEPLMRLRGTNNVTIGRLTLEGGRGIGVQIERSEYCVVKDSVIRNFGMAGVTIEGGTACSVVECEIYGNGEAGVTMDGGDRKTLSSGRHSVEGCRIHHVSRWCRTYRPAVGVSGVGNRVIGNRLSDLPHNAVLLSGNDHVVERNLVERVCTETGDAGAFYMGRDATMRGNVIRWNRFREVNPTVDTSGNFTEVMSVYLDDCWCGTSVVGNVFESKGTAIMIGGGRDNSVENNVFLGADVGISFDARGRGWAKGLFTKGGEWGYMERLEAMRPLEPPYSIRYPALASALAEKADLSYPAGTLVKRNLVFGAGTWIRYLDGLSIRDIDYADNVVSPEKRTLSEALKLAPPGFEPIPLDRIGVR